VKKNKVEQRLHTEEYYLQEHEEYTPERIYDICKGLIAKAESAGLEGCFLSFKSNHEPYEDYLGLPSIIPSGYREKTPEELQKNILEKKLIKYAEKHKITFYEAATLYKVRDKLGLEF